MARPVCVSCARPSQHSCRSLMMDRERLPGEPQSDRALQIGKACPHLLYEYNDKRTRGRPTSSSRRLAFFTYLYALRALLIIFLIGMCSTQSTRIAHIPLLALNDAYRNPSKVQVAADGIVRSATLPRSRSQWLCCVKLVCEAREL